MLLADGSPVRCSVYRNGWNDDVSTCPCCGKGEASETRQTVRVDDALMSLCNDAYTVAQQWSAREVGIAHVTWCIACAPALASLVAQMGSSRERLAQAAEKDMLAAGNRLPDDGDLRTSDDLKTLLFRAERIAMREGRDRATPREFLMALMGEASDLASATFLARQESDRPAIGAHAQCWRELRVSRTDREDPAFSRLQHRLSTQRDGQFARELRAGQANDFGADRHFPLSSMANAAAPRSGGIGPQAEPDGAIRALSQRLDQIERQAFETRSAFSKFAAYERRLDDMQSISQRLQQLERQGVDARDLVGRLAASDRQIEEMRSFSQRLHQIERQNVDARVLASRLAASERQLGDMRAQLTRLSETTADLSAQLAAELERTAGLGLDGFGSGEGSGHGASRRSGSRRRASRSTRSVAARARRMRRRMRIRMRRRSARRASMRANRGWGSRQRMEPVERSQLPVPLVEAQPEPAPVATPMVQIAEFDELPPADFDDDTDDTITREKRFYLTLDDDVEKAPSIGPRTAEQLAAARIIKVRHLLACDPKKVASRVSSRYINAERIVAWKAQARLVCTVPWLRGTHAQLLVGAGFDTLEKLARADTASVCAGILRFAATRYGQAVLRSGAPPTADRIAKWVEHVTLAEPERAA